MRQLLRLLRTCTHSPHHHSRISVRSGRLMERVLFPPVPRVAAAAPLQQCHSSDVTCRRRRLLPCLAPDRATPGTATGLPAPTTRRWGSCWRGFRGRRGFHRTRGPRPPPPAGATVIDRIAVFYMDYEAPELWKYHAATIDSAAERYRQAAINNRDEWDISVSQHHQMICPFGILVRENAKMGPLQGMNTPCMLLIYLRQI